MVEDVDEGDSGSYLGQYARIRVRIDISKSLSVVSLVILFGTVENHLQEIPI